MAKNIFSVRIRRGTFARTGDERLLVEFAESKNGPAVFEWTPPWLDSSRGVTDLLREAVRVERANKPGSTYLQEFAELARDIMIEHAPPDEVERIKGSFERYDRATNERGPRVCLVKQEWTGTRWWVHGSEVFDLDVPLPERVLRSIAFSNTIYDWVLWNGRIVDVQQQGESLLNVQKTEPVRLSSTF